MSDLPAITGFGHIDLSVTDADRSAAWWGRVLGFELRSTTDRPDRRTRGTLHPSGLSVILVTHVEMAPSMSPALRGGPTAMQSKNLAELYDLAPLEWAPIAERLAAGVTMAPGTGGPDRHSAWLATINADGSPHVTGLGAIWVDGAFWFETGETSVKGRNLARDPRCTLSLATKEFDLVVEGTAERAIDPSVVADMAERWADEGWPCRVDESGIALTADFSAPSAGSPPWQVFKLTPHKATALQTIEPGGATSWTFD
jgi:catechol 2,3-dioxygenase-like lactoylglutathione lyase family enzyme